MEKKEMIPLTYEAKTQNVCYIRKKYLGLMMIIKGILMSEIIVTTQENLEELSIEFVI